MISLEKKLEAILFYKAEPEPVARLAKLLEVSPEELEEAAHALSASLVERGVRLLRVNDELELVTSPEASDLLQRVRKEELSRDLGKAGAETLAIILYRGPVTRAQIDYIRGVNSTFILRNLQIRGLVERVNNPDDARSYLYRATPDLIKELGITDITSLPEYESVRKDIETYESNQEHTQESVQEITQEQIPEEQPASLETLESSKTELRV
jgi:segregation and condensation protein B